MSKVFFFFCLCSWSLSGVFGVDAVKSVSVTEGEYVTLNSNTEIQRADLILWSFGHNNSLIAKINRWKKRAEFPDERFRDRLKMDHQTGSLMITNTRTTDSGVYRVTSARSETPLNTFNLTVYGVFGVDEVKSVSVTEGESVTLNTDTEIQTDDLIMWRTLHNNNLIAIIKENNYKTDFPDERLRDRLKLDEKTGSLTITNTRTTDSGFYKVKSTRSETPLNIFSLTVYARLPVPVIFSHTCSSSSSSSSSSCSLVCSSVSNVSDATLSWYKGISILSSISVCDHSISLSLPLEVEYQDKNTYSCVLNNPISNQTTHLDINTHCHTCAGASMKKKSEQTSSSNSD